ncbi:hypothetical protein HK097_003806 [Rhizophlyctis rosea]|uniref:Uncharacterized protein n=1 Tax=Rhizophlyctis rosea TaxID=64517 RepID=A0AAD5S3Z0_9FUNG|nr:hypothetical protein HK097_003806 [Rhizophlyctis rosea]
MVTPAGPPRNADLVGIPDPFQTGDFGEGLPPKTIREISLIGLSNAIRNKPNWQTKVNNPEIVEKWKSEVATNMIPGTFDYVLAELRHDAEHDPQRFGIHAVRLVDDLVPAELVAQLKEQVRALEEVPDAKKDWHPGSNNQVLDLVHPSLFCYVEGTTPSLSWEEAKHLSWQQLVGAGTPPAQSIKDDTDPLRDPFHSDKFQWLPSEFTVRPDGSTTITSYINNLHPRAYQPLYKILAQIFSHFIPLFNGVLTDLFHPRSNRIDVDPYDWYADQPEPEDEDEWDEWHENREPRQPDIPTFSPPPPPEPSPKQPIVDLKGRNLQVIIKLASIHLTPSNPTYPGGVWHVEGMDNEHIVASGIYYYDVSNITESKLSFRAAVCEPEYEQNDDNGVLAIYGLQNEQALVQELGSVVAAEGRAVAFPNLYQHRVQPFSLLDPSKPGHRKILVFFLVDPSETVISTQVVPPQQREWVVEELVNRRGAPFRGLPDLVVERIVDYLGFPTLEEAKKNRQGLMDERKYFVDEVRDQWFEREFSLCEH